MPIQKASELYIILFSTLQDRYKKDLQSGLDIGGKTTFTAEQEKAMAEKLKEMVKLHYGLTPLEVRRIAYEYVENNNVTYKSNKETKCAGKDWFCRFIKSNKISICKPEATSMNRVLAFNEDDVNRFCYNIEVVQTEKQIPAKNIWNMDESEIFNVQQPEKVVAETGQKRIGAITSGERGKNITIICAMSASGNYVRPMFIYPRKRMAPELSKNSPNDSIYHCSPNG